MMMIIIINMEVNFIIKKKMRVMIMGNYDVVLDGVCNNEDGRDGDGNDEDGRNDDDSNENGRDDD